jgi:hypothetical protein
MTQKDMRGFYCTTSVILPTTYVSQLIYMVYTASYFKESSTKHLVLKMYFNFAPSF